MTPLVAQIVIGWPAVISSLLVASLGIVLGRGYLLAISALMSVGFAWYLTCSPATLFKVLGYSTPLMHLAATLSVYRRQKWPAMLVLLPYLAVVLYFGTGVILASLKYYPGR
ncbi:MAG: hypothetical protein ACUVRC_06660 [Desulfotomaculales bacterium]